MYTFVLACIRIMRFCIAYHFLSSFLLLIYFSINRSTSIELFHLLSFSNRHLFNWYLFISKLKRVLTRYFQNYYIEPRANKVFVRDSIILLRVKKKVRERNDRKFDSEARFVRLINWQILFGGNCAIDERNEATIIFTVDNFI